MTRLTCAAVVVAALAFAAVADAGTVRFGSSLKPAANHIRSAPVDTVYWSKGFANGNKHKVPAKGRIEAVKIKGKAIKRGGQKPVNLFHIQVLRPVGDGRLQVKVTSGNFHLPYTGSADQVNTYHPVNLCVRKGDYVGFSHVGGYRAGSYPQGTPWKIFSDPLPGSITGSFTGAGKDNNGDIFRGNKTPGQELLMRMVEVTDLKPGSYCATH